MEKTRRNGKKWKDTEEKRKKQKETERNGEEQEGRGINDKN